MGKFETDRGVAGQILSGIHAACPGRSLGPEKLPGLDSYPQRLCGLCPQMPWTGSHPYTNFVFDRPFFKLNGFTYVQPASVHF